MAGPPSRNFREAVRWFRDRLPIKKDEWLKMNEEAQAKAFTIAGVAQVDLVAEVFRDAVKALEKGESIDDFRKRVGAKLEAAWGEDRPWHVENIMRTNLQRAYSHARWEQSQEPALLRLRPYKRFSAVLDARTTEHICRPAHGVVLKADHPWWKTHIPPLHFQCRSAVHTLTAEQALELGLKEKGPKVDVMDGFGRLDEWEPETSDLPPPLARAYRRGE